MPKEIWLGPVLGTNRDRLLARCAEYLARGETDRLIYIAASHPLLDLATRGILDGQNSRGVWGEFPFYLFRGFVRRVLSSTSAIAPRVPIDREELPLRRSLISQIIKQLAEAGQLPAIRRLANRDGCITTVASLIGELHRAGTTAGEFQTIIQSRSVEDERPKTKAPSPKSQSDFDQDVALIYAKYSEALDRFGLTDDDADQLQALQILRGDAGETAWLDDVDLLVLDGFFDFTPVQGEMLRLLIPRIPNVVVNINHDSRNEQIFQPFGSTIEQLKSIAQFEVKQSYSSELRSVLQSRLFGANESPAGTTAASRMQDATQTNSLRHLLRECSDRETELRWIAKEIKRLIFAENYRLAEIALVMRERAAYADPILRVFDSETVPCNLERRVPANEIPCVRATAKLFQILKAPEREHIVDPKANEIAHLVKTGYFQISPDDLEKLTQTFDKQYGRLLDVEPGSKRQERLRRGLDIGSWSPDVIENVIAYVGSELRVRGWLDRAARLIRVLPSSQAARSFIGADTEGNDAPAMLEFEPPAEDEAAPKEKPKRPAPVHPAAIAWTMLLMEHVRQTIAAMPEEGTPNELRTSLMGLLERFEFSKQVSGTLTRREGATDVPQVMLNIRGMEALRRALAATVRSFDFAKQIVSEGMSEARASARAPSIKQPSLTIGLPTRVRLASFIDEVERCLKSQVLSITAGDRDGVRVLEATDVRGLKFRAMFIAGMNEGSFPLRTSRDWLYPHEERERLKKHGVILEDISTETLVKEEHYFYQCACRATERLYLTRPLAADDGIETVASYYIEELRRAIAPCELDAAQVRSDVSRQDILRISNISELATKLIVQQGRQSQRRREDILPAEVVAQLISKARHETYISDSVLRRVAIELQRGGDRFGSFDGQITNDDLRAMIRDHFGPEYVYSASGLSAFGNCPFRFFAARVLRLQPRNEAALDLTAIDAGKLLHDILRRFFERHRKEYLPDKNRKALLDDLIGVADEVFAEHERKVPPLNERIWRIDCEIRKLILEQVLLHELRLQEKTQPRGMTPTYFELAFGGASEGSDPDSKTEYLRIERTSSTTGRWPVESKQQRAGNRSSSEAALIRGQIDRVDVSESCQSVVAYDYKLSQGARIIDMEAGRHLQIPIYLAALEQLFLPSYELAGGGYYRLRGKGKRLNQGLYRKMLGDCTYVSAYTSMVDDVQWQRLRRDISRRVWQFIDGMRAGDFRVKPSEGKKTCKFCDYSAACRYDGYRISRKN